MSKKKAFSGSTMTLKDFHGGTIPSDLHLPSAPGVIVRPVDRHDRQTAWGNRSDNRSRPNSSPALRHLDDKTPFLTHSPHIGCNFDEDERKPLDGVSAPRRTVSDDSIRNQANRLQLKLKPEVASTGRISGVQGLPPASHLRSQTVTSYGGRLPEVPRVGVHSQNFASSYPNAWAARKEAAGVTQPVQSDWCGPSVESKLAHASALEKVSSGRWQSKFSVKYQSDIEIVGHSERGTGINFNDTSYVKVNVVNGRDSYDTRSARHAEEGSNIDGGTLTSSKDTQGYERGRGPIYPEVKDKSPRNRSDGNQQTRVNDKHSGSDSKPLLSSESLERPKLKLLPRTKPLESYELLTFEHKEVLIRTKAQGNPEPPVINHKKDYQLPSNSAQAETVNEYGKANHVKSGLPKIGSGNQTVDRPKLSLKPRSRSQEGRNVERNRSDLFGGARPRELVLKERGIDNENHAPVPHSNRVNRSIFSVESVSMLANSYYHNEKTENLPHGLKIEKKPELNHLADVEGVDMQEKNGHIANWRNGMEIHRCSQTQPLQQQQERPPSPESWRKPIEQSIGMRYGKAASAMELAKAFSGSASDLKTADRFPNHRGFTGQTQIPFSRLIGPVQRRQVNGY